MQPACGLYARRVVTIPRHARKYALSPARGPRVPPACRSRRAGMLAVELGDDVGIPVSPAREEFGPLAASPSRELCHSPIDLEPRRRIAPFFVRVRHDPSASCSPSWAVTLLRASYPSRAK